MPVQMGVWRLGSKPVPISENQVDSEKSVEDLIFRDSSALDPRLMIIGRQVSTDFGGFVDLLAIDPEGSLVVIELKRNKTPRDVTAQTLDYASWVKRLSEEEISDIYRRFVEKFRPEESKRSFDEAFKARFGVRELPETLNSEHRMIIVAADLDESTERIIEYLAGLQVPINVAFFRGFKDGENQYLVRAWLISPEEAEARAGTEEDLPWNGEFYVSFGGNPNRLWEEARQYGFVSAGGAPWYSRSLKMLQKGSKIWVNLTGGVGYVAHGVVAEEARPIDTFQVVNSDGKQVPIHSLPLKISQMPKAADDPDKAEYLVRVNWVKAVSEVEAKKEKGFFGNQNSAARPKSRKWVHTVERLRKLLLEQ
jgi:hypothetical protein